MAEKFNWYPNMGINTYWELYDAVYALKPPLPPGKHRLCYRNRRCAKIHDCGRE